MMAEWPDWLSSLEPWPARYHGGKQRKPPEGVVLHCGHTDGDIGRYCENPGDGRRVSYHIYHDRVRQRRYQLVSLQERAYHAAAWGNDLIGMALRGPATLDPRDEWEHWAVQTTLLELREAMPSVRYCRRHSDDPGARRSDPGPGVRDEWVRETGLIWRKAS